MVKVIITAIVCITGLEAYALYLKIDGATLALVIAVIAGLGGFEAKALRDYLKGRVK